MPRHKRRNPFIEDEAEHSGSDTTAGDDDDRDPGSPLICSSPINLIPSPFSSPPSSPPPPRSPKGKERIREPPVVSRQVAAPPKEKPFRIHARRFALTFPQCSVSKEDAMKALFEHAKDLGGTPDKVFESIAIAQEHHKDGNLHLHIFLQYMVQKNVTRPNFFDFITGQHGNYQSCKSKAKWLGYIAKFDTAIATYKLDISQFLGKKKASGSFAAVVTHITQGQTLESVSQDLLPTVAMHLPKFQRFLDWHVAATARTKTWPGQLCLVGDHDWRESHFATSEIVDWLNANVGIIRPFKAAQLYVSSPPNFGKTSLVIWLQQYLRIYVASIDEPFYDGYTDTQYDLMVFDEFKGQRTIQHMNQLLQGGPMQLRIKGSQYPKKKNIPIIILSNYSPSTAYNNLTADRIDTFMVRLKIVSLDQPIPLTCFRFCDVHGNLIDESDSVRPSSSE